MKLLPYRADVDIFFVSKGFRSNESFLTNELFGDVVLDISTKNEVRGVEILRAVRFFESFGIDESFLRQVKSGDFSVVRQDDDYVISLKMRTRGQVKECSFLLREPVITV